MSDRWEGLNPPYKTIVADPPWDYEGKTPPWRSTSTQAYRLLPTDEIAALPVGELATGDAHLYLWTVLPMMAAAYKVVDAWGFTADTVVTWCKPGVGLGGGFRGNTEHLIVARRGDSYHNPNCHNCGGRGRGPKRCQCETPDWYIQGQPASVARAFSDTADGTWHVAPRGTHSTKPALFLDLIERMSPGPYCELFARSARLGWDHWGFGYESALPSQGDAPK